LGIFTCFFLTTFAVDYSLDVESFAKMVDKLGTEHVTYSLTPGLTRDATRMTNTSSLGPTTVSQSRLATAGTERKKPKEVSIYRISHTFVMKQLVSILIHVFP